jgi:hypothetical protein
MDAQFNTANLKIYSPEQNIFNSGASEIPATPNEWFAQRYPEQIKRFGSPFLELHQAVDPLTVQILPVSINIDFFAGVLGGRKDLRHHNIYFEPEMQWYFLDSDGIYKSTSAEKLANLYRALMMKCAEEMPGNVHKLNLFQEFRSDRTSKAVVQRAKNISQADASFFSTESKNIRIKGPELFERVARVFVEEMLSAEPGQILKLQEAYTFFRGLLKQRNLPDVTKTEFKYTVGPLIRDQFNVALRNDLGTDEGGVRGWKGVRLLQNMPS